MSFIYRTLVLFGQLALTFCSLLGIYLLFALMDYQGGIDGLLGLIVVQPLFGVILTLITIGLCACIGLPLRLQGKLRDWWLHRTSIRFGLLVLGIALLVSSVLNQQLVYDAEGLPKHAPNAWLAIEGWFITGFSLLHAYPPLVLQNWFYRLGNSGSAAQ
ncbi:hypothetical protein [Hymenobacter sp. BT730]|uniref:hypothetical protein n=1 Tax=Hymenobacter sp. BT730 TaxID=3063332 RepID=UPI0026DFCE9C|nr:hypothetical protein [Hymenobacter sp. BT730]